MLTYPMALNYLICCQPGTSQPTFQGVHTYLEGAGEVAQRSLEEEGAGSVEEEARPAGEAEALPEERTAAAEEAAGAARAAGAAGGAGAYCRGLPGP